MEYKKINMHNIKFIDNVVPKGNYALVRSSLNVPIKNGTIWNDFRIKKAIKTIRYLIKNNKKVIIYAHIGRDPELSLEPVYHELKKYILELRFAKDFKELSELKDKAKVILFENLRKFKEEKENDKKFAKKLAQFGDFFVQDAFSVLHREHASIIGLPDILPSYGGLLLKDELWHLQKIRTPKHKSVFVLGGAKFKTKEKLIEFLLKEFDYIFIGGAILNDFLKSKGYEVGRSLISNIKIQKHILESNKIILPSSVATINTKGEYKIKSPKNIARDDMIVDCFIGKKLSKLLNKEDVQTIVWNGPLGFYEGEYTKGTYEMLKLFNKSKAFKVAGGGDSVFVIEHLGFADSFSFISTAGGAMLEFITKEYNMPGLSVLCN